MFMALLYPVVVACSVILSLILDEENSKCLMFKYYVFLLKDGISDPVAAVRQFNTQWYSVTLAHRTLFVCVIVLASLPLKKS